MYDIPRLKFTSRGVYDLTTNARRLAAAEAMLEVIAWMPQTYHSRGPVYCQDAMARAAIEFVKLLRKARMGEVDHA